MLPSLFPSTRVPALQILIIIFTHSFEKVVFDEPFIDISIFVAYFTIPISVIVDIIPLIVSLCKQIYLLTLSL